MGGDFEYHNEPEQDRGRAPRARRVHARRHRLPRRRRLSVPERSQDRHDHLGRREHLSGRDRGGARCTSRGADAAVFGIPNDEFGEEVKAAVQLKRRRTSRPRELAGELIAHCRAHLAGYKAPRSIDFVAALPRHETGKLYKRLLRDKYWEGTGRKI